MNVFDKKTKRWRMCRGHGHPDGFCRVHQIHFYAETIQKHWRRHRTCSKIAVYKHLPTDLWRKVQEHMQPEYSKKFLEYALKRYESDSFKWQCMARYGRGLTDELRYKCNKAYYILLAKSYSVKKYMEYHY